MFLDSLYQYSRTERIAVCDGEATMTYRDLWHRSDAIADKLLRDYPGKKPVAIFGDKENDMLCCMFGAAKAGRPYVCLPCYYPEERINMILDDSEAAILLNPASKAVHEIAIPVISKSEIEMVVQEFPEDGEVNSKNYVKPGDVVCILYTSGSTGTPKGVLLSYENIETKKMLVEEFMGQSMQAETGRAINLAAYSFSASLSFVYYVLAHRGWTLYCVPRAVMADQNELLDYLEQIDPEVFACTPSMADRLLSSESFSREQFPSLRHITLGGEPALPDTVRKCRERFPGLRVINGYGVTEATASPLFCMITQELMNRTQGTFLPIGMTASAHAYIADDDGKRIYEDGATGELIIACACVSPGYLNRPELTEKAFFVDENGNRAYHTRDIVLQKEGYYYFIGRKDNQVKIGGNRFELEDVESNLRRVDNVRECAAAVKRLDAGTAILVAFVCRHDNSEPNMKTFMRIKQEMKKRVESYMIPTKIVFTESLPKNVNLKLDRAVLSRMAQEA